jgi:2-octaprenyl-6-methoxyphenol hydroxylase
LSNRTCDIAIVGGGPIGAALAIALGDGEFTTLVLEARSDAASSNDARALAISYGSRLILEQLGIWPQIEPANPIGSIHVSQRGGFGRTLLNAEEARLPALGYVVRYTGLQHALGSALARENADVAAGAEVTGIDTGSDGVSIRYRRRGNQETVAARLLVIADGGAGVGSHAGAKIKVREYGQDAVVGLVTTSQAHGDRAYERFTPDGPIALLPFENRCALVWTATPDAAAALVQMPGEEFLQRLQQNFGDRGGRFIAVEARARFPLTLRYAVDPVLARVVMLGNAAQALHPIAGQGFNLGLRDAWDLAEILLQRPAGDPGAGEVLSSYRRSRRADRLRGIALTHSLVKIFSNDFAPLRAARGTALALLGLAPPAKRAFMQRMIFGGSR